MLHSNCGIVLSLLQTYGLEILNVRRVKENINRGFKLDKYPSHIGLCDIYVIPRLVIERYFVQWIDKIKVLPKYPYGNAYRQSKDF